MNAWLKARLTERNTWIGLLSAGATASGYALAPELANAIATIVVAILSAVLVATKEH